MKARLPQGYGKQSVNQLMQQAQQMQENMKKKQEELEATEYQVTAGGGMVELTMTGKHEVTRVKLNPDIVQPDDIEMLEDLIMAATNEALREDLVAAAVNEAVRVVDEAAEKELGEITGGLNIPGFSL